MKKKAFTLIEVLIVIGILILLASLLMSAFVGAKTKGKEPVCINNLRQLATATVLYLEDQGGFPYAFSNYVTPLLKYGAEPAQFLCPTDFTSRGLNGIASHKAGFKVSYEFLPTHITDDYKFVEKLAEADPNHGIIYCPLHGKRQPGPPDGKNGFVGRILRARLDTSVTSVEVFKTCWKSASGGNYSGRTDWELFTDEPCPTGLCEAMVGAGSVTEVPCYDPN